MDCPKCQGEMKEFNTQEGVILEFCGSCHGLWFDEGEIAFYLEARKDFPMAEESLSKGLPTAYRCPKCSTPLMEIPFVPGEAVLVDLCPSCHGVFVDKGEVPSMERLSARIEPVSKMGSTIRDLLSRGYAVLGVTKR